MRKEKRNLAITEIFMILIAVIWFIPIYYLIVTTLKSSQEATANPLGLPCLMVILEQEELLRKPMILT